MSNQVIRLDGLAISDVQNELLQAYSENTLASFIDGSDYAIDPTTIFGTPKINVTIFSNSVDSSLQFGISTTKIFVSIEESIESAVAFGDIESDFSFTIPSIESTLQFGDSRFTLFVSANSTTTTNAFGDFDVKFIIRPEALPSQLQFGVSKTIMEITEIPNPEIVSTVVIPTHSVRKVIGPLGIGTTQNFGIATFIDNIHRLLIYKDDNISKLGQNDAVIIAGGIRLNPSITKASTASSGDAELPSNPVGFLSINIDGVDYKIPYYNS